jgi:hypothetical protein
MSSNQIPGVPEGWELVRIGHPVIGVDCVIDYNGDIVVFRGNPNVNSGANWPIIRKIEKHAAYRPFANAEEYLPQADRKISRVSSDNQQMAGFARSTGCDSLGLWMGDAYCTWDEMLDRGHVFLDDGTPFGVKIDE